jgi:2-polyprenyl-3-methyl-5-hydroxy-6-metoxy-1,4-benzoquinol methylase
MQRRAAREDGPPPTTTDEWAARGYYGNRRDEMLPFVPHTTRTLLDIGCGRGAFGSNVKEKLGATVWGVEIVPEAARIAQARLDRVLRADIGTALETLPARHFDCVTFNDVLEHLVDPYSVIAGVGRLLTRGGIVVASLPNVRHFPVAWDLIWKARWDYKDCGVLDRTHLRFFTPSSMRSLFEERGYGVELTGINPPRSKLGRLAARLAPPRFKDMQFLQFAVVATPME